MDTDDKSRMTNIALFGTSADPPTVAHRAILKWLSQHYDRVAVWASDNPFKDHQTSLQHREAMLRLVIEEINSSSNVSLHEELSDRRSLMSVNRAMEIWGRSQYSLVIGSDLTAQIRQWYHIQELLQKVQILIVPRPGYDIARADLEALQNLGGTWAIADIQVPAISSTAYREAGDTSTLTPPVKDYIRREQLYS